MSNWERPLSDMQPSPSLTLVLLLPTVILLLFLQQQAQGWIHTDTRHSQLHGHFLLTGWTRKKSHGVPRKEKKQPRAAPGSLSCRLEVKVVGASRREEALGNFPAETEITGTGFQASQEEWWAGQILG